MSWLQEPEATLASDGRQDLNAQEKAYGTF